MDNSRTELIWKLTLRK